MSDIQPGDVARFWSRVDRRGPGDCWPWVGACRPYGQINIGREQIRSHVASLWIETGKRPPRGSVVRHSCDNPSCVNPAHLCLGTQAENVADMIERRRHWAHSQENCKNGHRLDGENLLSNKRQRSCRLCHRDASARYKARRKLRPADPSFIEEIKRVSTPALGARTAEQEVLG